MKINKLILVSLFYLAVSGCKSVPNNNNPVKSAVSGCDVELNLNNYKEFLEKKESTVVNNPFSDACVPVSFNAVEEKKDIVDMVYYVKNLEFQPVLFNILGSKQNIDGYNQAVFMYKYKDYFLQVLKYNYNKELHYNLFSDLNYEFAKEFFFIHELFHLTSINLLNEEEQHKKEFLADIGAIFVFAKTKELSQKEIYNMAWEIFKLRKHEGMSKNSKKTHFDKKRWLSFIKNIENKMVYLEDKKSFDDIYKYTKKYI